MLQKSFKSIKVKLESKRALQNGISVMSIFLIIIGILGILVSLYNLYAGARYIAAQWHFDGQAGVDRNTVWQLNTLPALSTILLFTLKHWIFTIAILLPMIQMLLMTLPNIRKDEMPSFFQMAFPSVSGFVGKGIIVLGSAIVLTLSLTSQNTDNPTLLSWYFPVLLAAFWGVTWFANLIFGWLVGALAGLVSR